MSGVDELAELSEDAVEQQLRHFRSEQAEHVALEGGGHQFGAALELGHAREQPVLLKDS